MPTWLPMRNHTECAGWSLSIARPSWRLSRPARPQASITQRAVVCCSGSPLRCQLSWCVRAGLAQLHLAHDGAVDEADAAALRLLAQEVLEQPAVDLPAAGGQRPAGADLGDVARCRAGLR
jgi:hypothetical protein